MYTFIGTFFISTFSFSLHTKRNTLFSHICFANIRSRLGIIKSSVMKGIVLIVFDESSLFCQSFEVPRDEVHRIKCRLTFPSQFQLSPRVSRFLHFMYFSVCEKETLLFFLMNLLTGPALDLRCSQFEIRTYLSSQLTEHKTYRKH